MEKQICDFLTVSECDYISMTRQDTSNPIVKYYCECANETESAWLLIQNNPKCLKCDNVDRPSERDYHIVERGLSLGFRDMKIRRIQTKHRTVMKISFVCKCGKREEIDSQTFNKVDFKTCEKCKFDDRKSLREEEAVRRGFQKAIYIPMKSGREKTIWKVEFTCKCGNPGGIVKSETFEKEDFAGCKSCSTKAKSAKIRNVLGSITEDKMKVSMSENGFHNLRLIEGENSRNYKVLYNCVCGSIVEKLWRSVEIDPLCITCMKSGRKNQKNKEIEEYVNRLGYKFMDSYRSGDKSRITVMFKCKCGNIKESLWDVMSRAGFSGCEDCAAMVRIRNLIENSHTDAANAKRRETNMANSGVPCNLQDPKVKEKIRNSIKAKYGVDNLSQSEEIKQKKKETCMMNYGVESPMQSEYVRDKSYATMINTYGKINASQVAEIHIKQQKFSVYTSESGKEYKYQGYEHFAIKKLIEEGINEDKINTCFKLCSEGKMPDFTYVNDSKKECTYFPDLMFEDVNGNSIYIEVKSHTEVFSLDLDKKIKSVIDGGFDIIVWKFNPYGKLVGEHIHRVVKKSQ
jgi:hypothetical protein